MYADRRERYQHGYGQPAPGSGRKRRASGPQDPLTGANAGRLGGMTRLTSDVGRIAGELPGEAHASPRVLEIGAGEGIRGVDLHRPREGDLGLAERAGREQRTAGA